MTKNKNIVFQLLVLINILFYIIYFTIYRDTNFYCKFLVVHLLFGIIQLKFGGKRLNLFFLNITINSGKKDLNLFFLNTAINSGKKRLNLFFPNITINVEESVKLKL